MFPGLFRGNGRLGLCERDGESEYCPTAGAVFGPDPSAMRFDDAPANREPKSHTTFSGGFGAVKLVEDSDFLAGRNPLTSIRHFDHRFPVTGRRRQLNDASRG